MENKHIEIIRNNISKFLSNQKANQITTISEIISALASLDIQHSRKIDES